jgi:phage tail sheath protein FI
MDTDLYARFDLERGVWKAPAGLNAKLHTARGVEIELTDQDTAQLREASINPIRYFADQGIVTWGARTFLAAASPKEWLYVPVRRLALFVEESLNRGLAWAVFAPNGEALWAQIRLAASSFMNQLFRSGGRLLLHGIVGYQTHVAFP